MTKGRHVFKKTFSVILTLVMVFTMIPAVEMLTGVKKANAFGAYSKVYAAEKEETLAKSAACEYCGTDHHFFLARAICFVIKAIYHMIGLFTVIDF